MQIVKCDALVVGGGLEGSWLALALHRQGYRTVLLDRGRPRDPDCPYDQWVNSPFLCDPQTWSWIGSSLAQWESTCEVRYTGGLAVAPRESQSWLRLEQVVESHCLRPQPLDLSHQFPELKVDSGVGHLYLNALPTLVTTGAVATLWRELQREGADPYADTEVRMIDWEHDWPTAVTGDTAFRAKKLYLMAGRRTPALLGRELPPLFQAQQWLEATPQSETKWEPERPSCWVHYARAPLYLLPRGQRWGMGRLQELDSAEDDLSFLRNAQQRWLNCPMVEPQVYGLQVDGLSDGQPVLDFHPWRQDCLYLAGVGQTHWAWLPALLAQVAGAEPKLPPQLSSSRLDPPPRPENDSGRPVPAYADS